ncbi:MAG: phospho-sugar mutase, partial [Acidimicrobiales bacterium]
PLLAYATRHLNADAGVMVTASHNPAEYNGYKVYLGDGAQIIPPVDAEISTQIEAVHSLHDVPLAPPASSRIHHLDDTIVDRYLVDALSQSLGPAARDLCIVYTPMHGVGGALGTRLLAEAGFADVHIVSAQFQPDPDFPTVAFPNPEEHGALDLALGMARRLGAGVVLANDPDADRLGAAIPVSAGGWRQLSGDEIGVLLADHILRHTSGSDRLVVTSIVSSSMLSKMAGAAGVHYLETLTGFKWLARSPDSHPGWRFLFGYEEALGYCVGTIVRDKDGLTAALLFAELVAGLQAEGRSVQDRLDEMAVTFGAHVTKQWSSVLSGFDGAFRITAIVDRLRTDPPTDLDGLSVTEVVDLQRGSAALPPTEGVILHLGPHRRVIVRRSGTEPKVKIYFEVVEPVPDGDAAAARTRGAAVVSRLQSAMVELTGLPAPALVDSGS